MAFLLTIAGHDPVHGAGITADLATWAAMGLDGASVVTALTVQNSTGLTQVEPVAASLVRDALRAVLQDGEPQAVKIGMLGSAAVVREVAEFVAARRCPIVLDPVLAASNGHKAYSNEGEFLLALHGLMRHVDVIVPNLPEAAVLANGNAMNVAMLRSLCRGAVVVKGGHESGEHSVDWVCDENRSAKLWSMRLSEGAHGTGCVFSAAVAGMLAQGWDVFDAAAEAKLRVHAGIAQSRVQGPGRAHTGASVELNSSHLPALQWMIQEELFAASRCPAVAFPVLSSPLGFYPVVSDADWVDRLLDWGVRTVQLRIKASDMPERERRIHIGRAVQSGRSVPGAQVFINDHWQDALEVGAYGVHLGQEDIEAVALDALSQSGMRLGVSSHTPAEMSRAHALQPSYVAIGPVYPTTLKAMRYEVVGLKRLREWTERYHPRYPVVAIGGISLKRVEDVLACGVDSVAVVSAVTQAAKPQEAVRAFLELIKGRGLAGATSVRPRTRCD